MVNFKDDWTCYQRGLSAQLSSLKSATSMFIYLTFMFVATTYKHGAFISIYNVLLEPDPISK